MPATAPPRQNARVSGTRGPATRDRALSAARCSILEIGATRTTMVEVARRSGVGRTTLYRHWPDITALLADLLTRELLAIAERVEPGLRTDEAGPRAAGSPPHGADSARPDPGSAPRDADELARLLCTIADEVRTDPLLGALRRETGLLSEYVLHRLGTSQRRLIGFLRELLAPVIASDPRLTGRDADHTATMLFLAVQGVVLSAPLADPPLTPDAWRAELHLLVRGYLGP